LRPIRKPLPLLESSISLVGKGAGLALELDLVRIRCDLGEGEKEKRERRIRDKLVDKFAETRPIAEGMA